MLRVKDQKSSTNADTIRENKMISVKQNQFLLYEYLLYACFLYASIIRFISIIIPNTELLPKQVGIEATNHRDSTSYDRRAHAKEHQKSAQPPFQTNPSVHSEAPCHSRFAPFQKQEGWKGVYDGAAHEGAIETHHKANVFGNERNPRRQGQKHVRDARALRFFGRCVLWLLSFVVAKQLKVGGSTGRNDKGISSNDGNGYKEAGQTGTQIARAVIVQYHAFAIATKRQESKGQGECVEDHYGAVPHNGHQIVFAHGSGASVCRQIVVVMLCRCFTARLERTVQIPRRKVRHESHTRHGKEQERCGRVQATVGRKGGLCRCRGRQESPVRHGVRTARTDGGTPPSQEGRRKDRAQHAQNRDGCQFGERRQIAEAHEHRQGYGQHAGLSRGYPGGELSRGLQQLRKGVAKDRTEKDGHAKAVNEIGPGNNGARVNMFFVSIHNGVPQISHSTGTLSGVRQASVQAKCVSGCDAQKYKEHIGWDQGCRRIGGGCQSRG